MGMYVYLTEWDLKEWRKPSNSDQEFRDLFIEALSYDKSLMVKETHRFYRDKNWFGFPTGIQRCEMIYNIYHECYNSEGQSLFEARFQASGSGSKRVAEAYLYGIINGNLHKKLRVNNEQS